MKAMIVFGTRPEAIKMCPLVKKLQAAPGVETYVCSTGQHRQMLKQVTDIFATKVDYSLDIMRPDQTLSTITEDILSRIRVPLQEFMPDIVLVHGDTTSSFAAALASFYMRIPVGHVEAGLRTYNRYSPFPEEMNRSLISRIAELHFAPTDENRRMLAKENITKNVFVTGNTVIDALKTTLKKDYIFQSPALAGLDFSGRRTILLTAHRRENLGKPMEDIFGAVKRLHDDFPDLQFVYPVHLNPQVQKTAHRILGGLERVFLIDPIGVGDMHNLISQSYMVMTDSGGLQEEAPYCNIPVLVLRCETERTEALEAGTVRLAGINSESIYEAARLLLTDISAYESMARAKNPYGDGRACDRIVEHLLKWHRLRA